MPGWCRLVFFLGVCTGYLSLIPSAKKCTFQETSQNLCKNCTPLQQWLLAILDTYPKYNTQGVTPLRSSCSPDGPQDVSKYTIGGIFSLIRPQKVYYVNPKVYNVIRITGIRIPEYQTNQKTNNKNQYKENKTPNENYYQPNTTITSRDASEISSIDTFSTSLNKFENLFYQTNFDKLTSISPPDRKVNGISFVQSGLFMYLALIALSTEVDPATRREIDKVLAIEEETMEKIDTVKNITSLLPVPNKTLKFRWGSRLLMNVGVPISRNLEDAATALNLKIMRLTGTETSEYLGSTLNNMVEEDSGGTLRNSFDEDDFNGPVCSILVTTVNIRARWRSAPTVLNGTRKFSDAKDVKQERSVRMIKINDIMRYVSLTEWNAEAIEINYATPGLTLLLVMPNSTSLRGLAAKMARTDLQEISDTMSTMRISAIIPLYTLRMTLLLPEKLRSMGIKRLFANVNNGTCDRLTISHAVQRLMFWSEAGRYAYKDDGLQWDETPEREIIVNRPYLFYVRWKNITLMNGNFVL